MDGRADIPPGCVDPGNLCTFRNAGYQLAFFGVEKFKITVTRNIVIRVIDLLCVFVFVKERSDLWKYALIMTLGTLCSQGYLWLYLRKLVDWRRPKIQRLEKAYSAGTDTFYPNYSREPYTMMDNVMLGQMSTMSEVGYYEGPPRF